MVPGPVARSRRLFSRGAMGSTCLWTSTKRTARRATLHQIKPRRAAVNHVLPEDQPSDLVSSWTEQLIAGPTLALSTTKRLLNKSFEMSLDQALGHGRVAASLEFSSEDGQGANRASRENRTPSCRGR